MTKTLFALVDTARSALHCVWIETGNPRQPLACVWIDREVRIAHDNEDSQREGHTLIGDATFGQVLRAADPRIGQIAAKFQF